MRTCSAGPSAPRCILAVLLAVAACVGCGYSNEALIDTRYRTVYVQTFDNLSWYRGFEVGLTRAVVNEINERTRMKLAPRDSADTLLTGKILDFKQNVLTETATDNIREIEVTLVVDMTWLDLRTGRAIKEVRNFVQTRQAKFDIGQTLDTATADAFTHVAERLVNQLEFDW